MPCGRRQDLLDPGCVYRFRSLSLFAAAGERPSTGSNHIRNSVKVVVDIYDGGVSFYIMNRNTPVLNAYRHAFPEAFRDLSDLSAGLKLHLR